MLDFYQQHHISPVRQDITDLPAHFARRRTLYRQLGLWPKSIEGKSVLEIGPGEGDNALYVQSLSPKHQDFIEPNPAATPMLRNRFPYSVIWQDSVENSVALPSRYDVVLCEGVLGLCGTDPAVLLEHVVKYVKVGGLLVITCIDAISDCSEVLRRAMAQRYINKEMSLQEKVEALRPIFAPHLATLKGVTRSVDDWILDNLINPASIGPTFSVPEACAALEGRFELMGSSPRFLQDWRWYKDSAPGNQWAINGYWANCHNLMDYRTIGPSEEDAAVNQALLRRCERVRANVAELEQGEAMIASSWFEHWMRLLKHDPGWFGRGQQYLSFERVA